MSLNFRKLKIDISSLSNQIRFMRANKKLELNGTSIDALKLKVTILCSIKAEHRNKLHRQTIRNPHAGLENQPSTITLTRKDQVELIQRTLKDYEQDIISTNDCLRGWLSDKASRQDPPLRQARES